MKKIEQKNVRFYAKNDKDQKAWDILQNLDKARYSSLQDFIIEAIISLYNSNQRMEDDPFLETREREEKFINKIAEGVERQLSVELPGVINGYLMGMLMNYKDALPVLTDMTESMGEKQAVTESMDVEKKQNTVVTEVEDNGMLDLSQLF